MQSKKIYLIRYLKQFNKFLVITWAIVVLILAIYYFGAGNLFETGPLSALAQEDLEMTVTPNEESVEAFSDRLDSESQEANPNQDSGSVDNLPEEKAQTPEHFQTEQAAEALIAPQTETPTPQEVSDFTSRVDRTQSEIAAEAILQRPTPVPTPYPTPQPTPTPYPTPISTPTPTPTATPTPTPRPTPTPDIRLSLTENVCESERAFVTLRFSSNSPDVEAFILEKNGQFVGSTTENNPTIRDEIGEREVVSYTARIQVNNEQFSGSNTVRVTGATCSRPTPTPTPTATPVAVTRAIPTPTPTTSVILGNQVINDVVRTIPQGAADSPCPNRGAAVITTRQTICDNPQVLAAVATPTPTPLIIIQTPTPTPRSVATPTPTAIARFTPTPTPTPLTVIAQSTATPSPSAQVRVITANNVITIPIQTPSCPAGSTRVRETDQQIICQVNAVQAQNQVQTKQIVLTGASNIATVSGAPKVITQVQTPAKELPNTGLPAAALGLGSLIPFGMGLRRWGEGKSIGLSANSLWVQRQLKD